MKNKDWELPEIDLSHDEGDERWHEAGGHDTTPEYKEDGVTVKWYRWNGLGPGHYKSYYQLCVVGSWAETVTKYEANPDDVHRAWWYIDTHPVFWKFDRPLHEDYPKNHVSHLVHQGALEEGWPNITPHKVNPKKGKHGRVTRNEKKNTKLQWWYEFGPSDMDGGCKTHDWELDGGADSYEECILAIARKIHKYYGNDRSLVDAGDVYWRNRKIREQPGGWGKVLKAIHQQMIDRELEDLVKKEEQ